jgi:lipoate-protein ligase A
MKATNLSQVMYLDNGALAGLTQEQYQKILRVQREKFFAEMGEQIRSIFEQIKAEKIGQKPDWDKFTELVKKAVEEILEDNRK